MSLPASDLLTAQKTILRWRENPDQFVTDVFNITPEKWQKEALLALARHGRVSVRSGHGVGKSACMAWAALWHMLCFFPQKTPCSAPTSHQLEDVLWSEIATWHRKMPPALRDQIILKELRMELATAQDESFAVARTGRKENPEALQGFHSPHVLFLIDEASGVDDIVFQVAEGALTGEHARVFMAANPTRNSGYFHDSHHKMRHLWHTIHVSCFDSTQVNPEYAEQMAIKYGKDSNVYRVRVMGEFPLEDDDVLMPLSLVMAAVDRDVEPITSYMPVWGLDVARFGNCRTALAKRQGNVLMEPIKSWRKRDLMEVSGLILNEYEETDKKDLPGQILVDSVGLGAGVVDRLKELGLPVRGINVGESPSAKPRFSRLRDELWWRSREWFEARDSKIPMDDNLIGQLTGLKYKLSSSGKIEVERKEKLMERGLESPDEADAFVLTFAASDKRGVPQGKYMNTKRRKPTSWMTR